MVHSLGMIEFSCRDARTLAGFWSHLLGVPVDDGASTGYAQLTPAEPLPKWLFVQREPAGVPGSLLLALTSYDIEGDVEAAVAAGATSHGIQNQDGFVWATLTDPEGNYFTFNAPPPR